MTAGDALAEASEAPDLLDTNVICRYLLNDHPGTMSARAAALIESAQPLVALGACQSSRGSSADV